MEKGYAWKPSGFCCMKEFSYTRYYIQSRDSVEPVRRRSPAFSQDLAKSRRGLPFSTMNHRLLLRRQPRSTESYQAPSVCNESRSPGYLFLLSRCPFSAMINTVHTYIYVRVRPEIAGPLCTVAKRVHERRNRLASERGR